MFWKREDLSVAFATSCWERDWRTILLDPTYLAEKQIGYHRCAFKEKILVINNVKDRTEVLKAAEQKVREGVLTHIVLAEEIASELLTFFHLKREDFLPGPDAGLYPGVNPDWIYYNALGPLAAIYSAKSDYLLYLTGDVRLEKPVRWVERAVRAMEEEPLYKIANLTWNDQYKEAKRESMGRKRGFYISSSGFSDQLFLAKQSDLRAPIYSEIREDASHFPRGDVFEKRLFSAMKNRGWLRLTYTKGSYLHENI